MPQTVLITSITGFLGAQILADTCKAGFKLFEVKDLIHGDLSKALEGVDAILHVASPYTFKISDPKKDLLDPAIEGTLNVLRQAQAAGVKRVVITSSFAAVNNFKLGGIRRDYTYTEKDWNPATYEEAAAPDVQGAYAYSASKKLAEQAAWDFAKDHPEMEITTLNPPMIYGPSLHKIPSEDAVNTSTGNIWNLISGKTPTLPDNRLPLFCDSRDVSKAHLRALERPESIGTRVLLCGGAFTWEEAADYLKDARPELADKLPKPNPNAVPIEHLAKMDTTVAKEKLGMDSFIDWKKTLLDTVDDLVQNHAKNW